MGLRTLLFLGLMGVLAAAPAGGCFAAPAAAGARTPHGQNIQQADTLMRVVQVDLDYIHDANPVQTERNLSALVERLRHLNVGAVFLQGFADPNGTGLASATYFPNRFLPLRDDLMRHATLRLQQEAHVKVLGWLPVLSFDFNEALPRVQRWNNTAQQVDTDPQAYHRLSPFDDEARQAIIDIYTDMARQVPLDGVLFHDDAMLSDYEDASPAAIDAYKQAGFADNIPDIRADAQLFDRWTTFKTDTLIKLTHDIAARLRRENPRLITVRNIYAPLLIDHQSRNWFAQDYGKFLNAYDYVAVEAMPRMEKISDDEAEGWLQRLVVTASEHPNGLARTIFEFQAVDWNKQRVGENRAIPTHELADQMHLVSALGGKHLGYYPDDFAANTPDINLLRPAFSPQAQKLIP